MKTKINRVLIVASVASMIDQFNMPNIRLLKRMGYDVDIACNFIDGNTCTNDKIEVLKANLQELGVRYYQIDFARNVFKIQHNLKALWQIRRLMTTNNYTFAHCHSPIGGMLTRIAGRMTGTKVIYTAHGFHFYTGAPLLNWMIYYPIEWICSYWTDILITINQEDYNRAKRLMHAKKIVYLPGIGVDITRFGYTTVDRQRMRNEFGIPWDSKWILTVGELIPRKNQETLIHAVAKIPNVFLTIAGQGALKDQFEALTKRLGIENRVKFLGFRTDITNLCKSADIFAFPSLQEGLSVALMEAMACAKPCVVSNIRGNVDLIDEKGGELFEAKDVVGLEIALKKILSRDFDSMGHYNVSKIKGFDLSSVLERTKDIYATINGGGGYRTLYQIVKRIEARKAIGISPKDIVLFSIGELNNNKNHISVINAIKDLDVKYIIAGKGANEQILIKQISKINAEDRIKLLGFRTDIPDLLNACDIFVFPSFREGLSMSLMEAMASGKPCAVSSIRGNIDLIDNSGGELFNPADLEDICNSIKRLMGRNFTAIGTYNIEKIKQFSVEEVMSLTAKIYRDIISN